MAKTQLPIEITDKPVSPAELRKWRKDHDLKQWQAAQWLGVSSKTYENWEQGHRTQRHPVAIRRLMNLPIPRRVAKTLRKNDPQNAGAPE